MVNLPAGIAGWTTFLTGLLIITYRVHGIDAPREWVEWVEHQFIAARNIQLIGFVFTLAGIVLAYFAVMPKGILGLLFALSLGILVFLGLMMMFATNTARHIVLATAEAEDKIIKLVSILFVIAGLLWALAPWFL